MTSFEFGWFGRSVRSPPKYRRGVRVMKAKVKPVCPLPLYRSITQKSQNLFTVSSEEGIDGRDMLTQTLAQRPGALRPCCDRDIGHYFVWINRRKRARRSVIVEEVEDLMGLCVRLCRD